MTESNPYAPPGARVSDLPGGEHSPALWNPFAAALWSVLFTPLFGAILHMKNWNALGDPKRAAESKYWGIGYVVFFIISGVASDFFPESKALDAMTRVGGIAFLCAWYITSGKIQTAHIRATYGKSYARRGWLLPISIAVVVLIAVLALLFAVIMATSN